MMENQLLPIKYDQSLADFINKLERHKQMKILATPEKVKMAYEEIKEEVEPLINEGILKAQNNEIQTKIIQDLAEICETVKQDINQSSTPRYTSSQKHRKWIDDDTNDFYSHRVKQHAKKIVVLIEGLINRDGYAREAFGAYEELFKLICTVDGRESATYLYEMVISAQSMIPPSIRYSQDEIIESNNSYSESVDEV